MALTISGSGGGITRSEVEQMTNWQTVYTNTMSFRVSGSSVVKNQVFSGNEILNNETLLNLIEQYESVRIRIKEISYSGWRNNSSYDTVIEVGRSDTLYYNPQLFYKTGFTYNLDVNETYSDNGMYTILRRLTNNGPFKPKAGIYVAPEVNSNSSNYPTVKYSDLTFYLKTVYFAGTVNVTMVIDVKDKVTY